MGSQSCLLLATAERICLCCAASNLKGLETACGSVLSVGSSSHSKQCGEWLLEFSTDGAQTLKAVAMCC